MCSEPNKLKYIINIANLVGNLYLFLRGLHVRNHNLLSALFAGKLWGLITIWGPTGDNTKTQAFALIARVVNSSVNKHVSKI